MMEFWLISVPLDKISCQSLEKLKRVTAKSGLATSSRFHVPELKVGTLDVLLGLSDNLSRLDSYTEGAAEARGGSNRSTLKPLINKLKTNMAVDEELKTDKALEELAEGEADRAKSQGGQRSQRSTQSRTIKMKARGGRRQGGARSLIE
ncbi:V-type proton ATPase subunit C 1 [Anabarilius grahami]|uniref:V-type proton ATPase subunit C n=1 Tax=Anabarilius grahami TaxID=495550 RepID=A0A3N0YEW8_ANAGA|nr:V-type proton ATPase subunit C 1 [Anabarilius grahami]